MAKDKDKEAPIEKRIRRALKSKAVEVQPKKSLADLQKRIKDQEKKDK